MEFCVFLIIFANGMGGHILRGKGMVKFMRIAAAIAIAVALAGCSKSEDGTETVKSMDPITIIQEKIVGTWLHDGSRNTPISASETDGIIVNGTPVGFTDSESNTISFDKNGSCMLVHEEHEHSGTYEVGIFGLATAYDDGVTVDVYPYTYQGGCYYSSDYNTMYLVNKDHVTHRYLRQSD